MYFVSKGVLVRELAFQLQKKISVGNFIEMRRYNALPIVL